MGDDAILGAWALKKTWSSKGVVRVKGFFQLKFCYLEFLL